MSLDALRNGFGIINMMDNQDALARKEKYEKEVGMHMQGFQQYGDAYDPGQNYDGRAFSDAQIGHVSHLMKQEDIKTKVFERQKRETDASYQAILKGGQVAAGLLELGQQDAAIDHLVQTYDAMPDRYNASYEVNQDTGEITMFLRTDNGDQTVSRYKDKKSFYDALQLQVKAMSDQTVHAKTFMSAKTGNIQHNAKQLQNPERLTNDSGKVIYHYSNLLNTSTGRPMTAETEDGYAVTDGQYFFDPITKKVLTLKEVVEGGYLTQDEATHKASLSATKALENQRNKAAAASQGLAEFKSTFGKKADDMVKAGIFRSHKDAMRFLYEAEQTDNVDVLIGKLYADGLFDPDDEDDQKKINLLRSLIKQLPEKAKDNLPRIGLVAAQKASQPSQAQPTKKSIPKIPKNATLYQGYYYWIDPETKEKMRVKK